MFHRTARIASWLFALLIIVGFTDSAAAQSEAENAASAAEAAPEGFFGIVFAGGWVGLLIMLLLLALSLTAAYLVFEQLLTLRRGRDHAGRIERPNPPSIVARPIDGSQSGLSCAAEFPFVRCT